MKNRIFLAFFGLTAAHSVFAADLGQATPNSDPSFWNLSETMGLTTSMGLGLGYMPAYEGADKYKWRALPLVDVQRGAFFLGTARGLGVNLSPIKNFQFGPQISYRAGRDENDAQKLNGLGDIKGGLEAGLFARYKLEAWFVQGSIRTAIGDTSDGLVGQLSGGHEMRIGNQDRLVLSANLQWADDKYMQTYFGINPDQSIRSGYRVHAAGAGVKSYGAGVNWVHSFTGGWFANMGMSVKTLAGDAVDSPIVEQKTAVIGNAGFGYRF